MSTSHYLYEKARSELAKRDAEIKRLREVLKRITAHAGHPSAAEGCRIIIAVAGAALEGK